ncbi:putative PPPDE peptidase domain, PPPDE putative peptidase domain superfamily [Helianthus annuus]|uniref:PPPDE putative peptidase domain-containing protein n=1 Tax=Helianthus annuus TaxID=4232 RepID=A0A251VI86_HELAN|nr:deSI-like protein At4g17486 isoform X1 [Helianthus annuus]KAF5819200.1 putative PPPDE putative peptidase domain-containing protein [Helianthus annuus]KAJ0605388.1 putative PPPDE peptidase domain-containing protein [Helianthus annuus]KAJ0616180.1 putative PPPDE peptidase domain, PPPDE putative peptidase domain superfamily [Helianthus annuus]KAJ0619409.1 putative PPPDE peptidase domain-containing protein [Helianthus annuus]KAJ0777859.1 putative PPPDE peptidase domain-containing protein [Helia
MLCRMIPRKKKTGTVPVYLNVYDLTPINGYAYWVGLGVYHSGVQVHGVEYAFGAHEHPTTGIFEVEPRKCPGFTFRKSILIGRTDYGPREVRSFIEKLATEFTGNSYNLITRNCNHFCNDMCLRLTKRAIPSWVNRLARLGFLCNCVLPASLNDAKVRQVRAEDDSNADKKLRARSSRFASASKPQPQASSRSSSPSTTKNPSSGTNIKPLTINKDNKS